MSASVAAQTVAPSVVIGVDNLFERQYRMNDFTILPGEKFSIVAIPGAMPDASVTEFPLQLADDLWAVTKPPVSLTQHWQEWIGSIRVKDIERASLLLVAKRHSDRPQVLDGDNQALERRISRLYWGTLAVGPLICSNAPTLVQGGCHEEFCDVRQVSWMAQPYCTDGTVTTAVNRKWLTESVAIADALDKMPTGSFKRINRAFNAFFTAITTQDVTERLHEFARCIEGFILPEVARTEQQFKSRTELFVGPRHHEAMGIIYRLRSRIEHLNDIDPGLPSATDRERKIGFLKFVLSAENVARHCVRRVLANQALWPHFCDDTSLAAFWAMDQCQRVSAWGEPFDLTRYLQKIGDLQIPDF